METVKRQRRNHSPEFKARIALEALKGIKPIHEFAAENQPFHAGLAVEEGAPRAHERALRAQKRPRPRC